ncbi:MAG: hypothetical protein WCO42_11145 [bacterium]
MRKKMQCLMGLCLVMGMGLRVSADGVTTGPNGSATGVGLTATAPAAVAKVKDPALSKQRYDMIMGNLDAGGDLLVVANLEGMIKSGVDLLTNPFLTMGKGNVKSQAMLACVSKIPGFLDKNGFYALQGFGMSVVPRADGLNTVKSFIARDSAAAGLPLWRALVGANPKVMECTDFLPADTELARTGTSEYRSLWKLIRAGVAELGTPEAAAAFNAQLVTLNTNMGVNLDKVFDSFTGEGFFSIQLSRTTTIDLPGAGANGAVKMPQPSLLIGIAVSDNTLVTAMEAALAKAGMKAVPNEGELAGIKSINLPLPLPIPLQPSYAVHANVFLFGTTPGVVAEGIKAFKTKSGLTATPQFKRAFEGLPSPNNGIEYMSSRFMNTITEVQKAYMCQPGSGDVEMTEVMNQLLSRQQNMQSAMVIQNRKSGILTIGNSSASGKEMIASMMLAPVGMMAAIAIPSFMSARTAATHNGCVNNLRQLEAAKEQWALEKNKNTGDAVVESEVLQYVKGAMMPVCPQGGKYTLHTIGENCECSFPGHRLED